MKKILLIIAMFVLSTQIVYAEDNYLEIVDLDAYINGRSNSDLDDNGGRLYNVKPSDTVKLKITVQNTYPSDTRVDIEDIDINAVLEGIRDGDDIERDYPSTFYLKPQKKKYVYLEFPIPLEVEKEIFPLTITIQGEDENNTDMEQVLEMEIEIDKDRHKLEFYKLEAYPGNITCSPSTELNIGVINIGEEDEDEVKLTVKNSQLGIDINKKFDVSSGAHSSYVKYLLNEQVDIPEDAELKNYPVDVRVEYGSRTLEDGFNINIKECEKDEPEPTTSTTKTTTPTTTTPDEPETTTTTTITQSYTPQPSVKYSQPSTSSWDENKYFFYVGLAYLIVILLAFYIGIALLKK